MEEDLVRVAESKDLSAVVGMIGRATSMGLTVCCSQSMHFLLLVASSCHSCPSLLTSHLSLPSLYVCVRECFAGYTGPEQGTCYSSPP